MRDCDISPDETEKFFDRYGEYVLSLRFYGSEESVTVEDLYQHFKNRLQYEKYGEVMPCARGEAAC